ncbi:hypothetical protein [uncultured Ruegeria sp.]|uniref:hypothetical protein n=1 Tax=uncultured Ruegeria sp. TaxID=259304 RepID=UPI002602150E|nr:hypothetical protein [uncultured Ruegeria sp.]
MSRIFKLGLNGVIFLMAAHFLATPGYAQPTHVGSAGFIVAGGKHLSFHKNGRHKKNRYFVAPKAKSHAKHPKVHTKKPTPVYRYTAPKRRVLAHIPYGSVKRHKFKSFKFKHSYGFQRH